MKAQNFKDIQKIIEEKISSLNWEIAPLGLYKPIEYVLSLGGKRIRPVLSLMACSLFTNDLQKAVSPAVALEVFHNFTLLHDDIMDRADIRRGKPTVHVKWNDNTAILSGDTMLIKAYQLLSDCDEKYLKKILDVFTEVNIGVSEGQQYDMEFEQRTDVTLDEYINMIRLKTAVLLAGSLKIGAICGGASDDDANNLYNFGIGIGIAFQVQDDILDVYGDPEKFGKAIGGDICCNKKTYLLLTALEKSDATTKANILAWTKKTDFDRNAKIAEFTSIYDSLKVKDVANEAIKKYYYEALDSLNKVSLPKEDKEAFYSFAEKLLYRQV